MLERFKNMKRKCDQHCVPASSPEEMPPDQLFLLVCAFRKVVQRRGRRWLAACLNIIVRFHQIFCTSWWSKQVEEVRCSDYILCTHDSEMIITIWGGLYFDDGLRLHHICAHDKDKCCVFNCHKWKETMMLPPLRWSQKHVLASSQSQPCLPSGNNSPSPPSHTSNTCSAWWGGGQVLTGVFSKCWVKMLMRKMLTCIPIAFHTRQCIVTRISGPSQNRPHQKPKTRYI